MPGTKAANASSLLRKNGRFTDFFIYSELNEQIEQTILFKMKILTLPNYKFFVF